MVSVTREIMFSEIHFQKMTSSTMVCAFILDFISMLKICRVFPAARGGGRRVNNVVGVKKETLVKQPQTVAGYDMN